MKLQPSITTFFADSKPRAHLTTIAADMRELGFAVASVPPQRALLYRPCEGAVGTIALRTYSLPQPGSPRPLVWRWHIDHLSVSSSRRALVALGITPERGRRHDRCWAPAYGLRKLELSCLASELGLLASWLPKWLEARELGVTHAPCPVQLSREGQVQDYAWTLAAEQAMSEWTTAEKARRRTRTLAVVHATAVRRACDAALRGDVTIHA